ncbi:non-ribosomal peptide synthetase [Paenibacillus odorifer]|uniref:non-ribosomal peptide synthetase n=1 Tax=Paenibacillus odorifer TaxID=189426 RepID=UPI0020BF03F1|nr:non-ribosomal peptide synthetase [Paenibacillus odorifer]
METSRISTLTAALSSFTAEDSAGITFIDGDQKEETMTYAELYSKAANVLARLQGIGMKPRDELVIQLRDNRSILIVFWACLLGRMIPVPLSVGDNDEHKLKLFKVWGILNRPFLASDSGVLDKLIDFGKKRQEQSSADEMAVRVLLTEELLNEEGLQGQVEAAIPDDIAFIQFSSGSTGEPKGVVLTHENVMTNVRAIASGGKWETEERILCWMPLTHDMGLIGCHLSPLVKRMHQFHMPTALFIRRPSLWMKKASEHKVAILQSPNFGYKFFLNYFKPAMAEGWDLSTVRQMMNGAEPISYSVCEMFLDAVEPYGFRRNAMFPVYGLAEATVGVSFSEPGESVVPLYFNRSHLNIGEPVEELQQGHADGICFVDVGRPIDDCLLRICDDLDAAVQKGVIGHIQISGKNVMSGYYNNPQATQRAKTADGWIKTGDLGLIYHGKLIVTGRSKDIIFSNGLNYYPHDIERVAEEVDGIEMGKVAACSAYNNQKQCEELLLFVLFKKKSEDFNEVARSARLHILEQMNLTVDEVIPVRSLPKTTSGKIQRYKLGQSYSSGEFDAIKAELETAGSLESMAGFPGEYTLTEQVLLAICREVLQHDNIGVHDLFFEAGIDSLKIKQFIAKAEDFVPGGLHATDLFTYPSVSQLARAIDSMRFAEFSALVMPQSWLADAGAYQFEREAVQFTIEGDTLLKLSEYSIRNRIEASSVIMAGLAFLLSKVTGSPEIVLPAMLHSEDYIENVRICPAEAESLEALYRLIQEKTSRKSEVPAQALEHISSHGHPGKAVPVVCRAEYTAHNARYLERQDLLFILNEKMTGITVNCQFNRLKLRSDKIRELAYNFNKWISLAVMEQSSVNGAVVQ